MDNTVTQKSSKKQFFTTKELTFTALMSVLIIICSWISIPTAVPFTLQTFAVFFSLVLLGGKCGTFSVLTFLLLGAFGLPVFSEFKGGIGALFGITGGYILGFLLTTIIFWLSESIKMEGWLKILRNAIAMIIGLAACYLFGTLWFMHVYSINGNSITFMGALGGCVLPYIAFDLTKLTVALILGGKLRKMIFKH